MNDYDKGYLITGIEDGWIDPDMDAWYIYCKLKGIDEHSILAWLKKIVGVFFDQFRRLNRRGEI